MDATRRQEGCLEGGLVLIRLGTKCGLQTHMRCVCVCVYMCMLEGYNGIGVSRSTEVWPPIS